MAVVFSVRGTLAARYSTGSAFGFGTDTVVTTGADAGALSGNLVALTTNSGKALIFDGKGNCGESRAFSILLRFKANYTGAPTANRVLFQLGLGKGSLGPYVEFWHSVTTGNITGFGNNQLDARTFNSASFGAWTGITSGTYYDFVFTWDGTTTANAAKVYIDATLLGQVTAGQALTASWKSEYFNPIIIGSGSDVTVSNYSLDEFVIWDSVIDPTAVALVSGTGSLNGASRTSLVDAAAVDASVWTALAASKIQNAQTQTQAGIVVTGTLVSTDPGIANVRSGTGYTIESAALTGTLDLPSIADVKLGVQFDNTTKTGTYVAPTGGSFTFVE